MTKCNCKIFLGPNRSGCLSSTTFHRGLYRLFCFFTSSRKAKNIIYAATNTKPSYAVSETVYGINQPICTTKPRQPLHNIKHTQERSPSRVCQMTVNICVSVRHYSTSKYGLTKKGCSEPKTTEAWGICLNHRHGASSHKVSKESSSKGSTNLEKSLNGLPFPCLEFSPFLLT